MDRFFVFFSILIVSLNYHGLFAMEKLRERGNIELRMMIALLRAQQDSITHSLPPHVREPNPLELKQCLLIEQADRYYYGFGVKQNRILAKNLYRQALHCCEKHNQTKKIIKRKLIELQNPEPMYAKGDVSLLLEKAETYTTKVNPFVKTNFSLE